ncbi:hypothetical protein [Brevundimonas sp.]|uniref:hypothetical protein n=1 Tax=Brevundimonas sp. TaxID=1871086 RepID=UPI0035AF6DC6
MADSIDALPFRLTTSQVVELAGYSARTLHRRIASGKLDLQPCDRGVENLYARQDVVRALRLEVREPEPTPFQKSRVPVDAIRAAQAASRNKRR